jgi:predicted phosphodiesterase
LIVGSEDAFRKQVDHRLKMKIAVIADVHANLPALHAVTADVEAWRPDMVIVLGDLVNRGPRPAECLAFVQEKARQADWRLVRGNHEDYVITNDEPDAPRSGPAFYVHKPSYWTYSQLGKDVAPLRAMPVSRQMLDPSGKEISFFHGSVLGMRDGIYPETGDDALRQKIGLAQRSPDSPPLAMFCVGHTHRPVIRELDGILVVNAGSAGLPFDLDTRSSYARLIWKPSGWQAKIVRLRYDLRAAEAARSHLYTWAMNYQDAALHGRIDLEESVQRHFAAYGY